MNIHEYQAKAILRNHGISVPDGFLVYSGKDVVTNDTNFDLFVVKAQIHAGGRGKAGGVKITKSRQEASEYADQMLNKPLVTAQTDANGVIVRKVYIECGQSIAREFYLSLVIDNSKSSVSIIASAEGGVNIEELSVSSPEKVVKVTISNISGLKLYHSRYLANLLCLSDQIKEFHQILKQLYELFIKMDVTQLEINPLGLLANNTIMCLDAKFEFNDDALFRQQHLNELVDSAEEDADELEALSHDLKYIKMDGDVACLVNGAGLAMATMDMIKLSGRMPANFLDIGGSADAERVKTALDITLRQKQVKVLLINIFGGIVQCDLIAEGLIDVVKQKSINIPIVIRLDGTNSDIAKKMLSDVPGLRITVVNNLEDISEYLANMN